MLALSLMCPAVAHTDYQALWHLRKKVLLRATRLGYNVMSIDADFMWFRDPYVHFKKQPLSNYQVRVLVGHTRRLSLRVCKATVPHAGPFEQQTVCVCVCVCVCVRSFLP